MPEHRSLLLAVVAMTIVVCLSNVLVQFPINDWLTWGAFSYPVAFLVTDVTNRRFGPGRAWQVACVGFVLAVALSTWLATPRIALASGTAFISAQLLDISIFDRLRRAAWWKAPLASSALASIWDTAVFFSLAFAATGLPWITWALGDLVAKAAMLLLLLPPYRALVTGAPPAAGRLRA